MRDYDPNKELIFSCTDTWVCWRFHKNFPENSDLEYVIDVDDIVFWHD